MAQLKSTVVQGSLRVTDTTYTNDLVVSDTTAPTIANNDYLLVADASDGNKLLKGPVFDGSTTSQALTKKGTWATFNNYSHPTGDGNLHVPATGTGNNGKVLKAGSTAGSLSWGTLGKSDVGLGNVANSTYAGGTAVTLNGTSKAASTASFYAPTAAGTSGQYLKSTEGVPEWASFSSSTVGLGNVSNNANLNSTTGAKGDIIYWSAANTPAHLTNTSSTTKHFLSITSQAPAWTTLAKGDVGLGNVENTALSTWAGTNKITTVGTISTGTWQGTKIGTSYLPTASTTGAGIIQIGTGSGNAAAGNHGHGHIQNGGTLQTNDITIGSGDKLVVTDSSDSSKIARTSLSFDGSTTSQVLTKKGTWEGIKSVIVIDVASNTATSTTISNSLVTANHIALNDVVSAATADITVTTAAGQVTVACADGIPAFKLLLALPQ